MESDPHRVLEGMAIAAYAVGAEPGLHLRPRRVSAGHSPTRHGHQAGQNAWACWAVRSSILPFDFRIDIRIGAGAYVCGEETALHPLDRGPARAPTAAAPLPGRRRPLGPSHPDQQRRDLRQRRRRSSATAATGSPSIGTEKSKGTKVFALAGKIRNTGAGRSADGDHASPDRRGDRRRRRPRARSRRCRPAGPRAAASPPSISIRRSTTSRSSGLARSWALAA